MAPVAWQGKVFIGNAGGDMFGVTGRVYALDAKTGREQWVFHTVPKTGPATQTWPRRDRIPPTGGATWTTYSVDPENGVLYFVPEVRNGLALYTNCLLAIDASTGKLLGYHQAVKKDYHDWDVASAAALVTTKGGRKVAFLAPKDGYLNALDRSGVGSKPGSSAFNRLFRTSVALRFNDTAKLTDKKFTRFAPGVEGGVEWNGPAYDPQLNLVFMPVIDWPYSVKLGDNRDLYEAKPGTPFTGTHDGGFGKKEPLSTARGRVVAVDAGSGKIKWIYRAPTPMVAAVTPTAGGIVFAGDLHGNVSAFDSRDGQLLWRDRTGCAVGGGIVSYAVDGKQYIAVAAGINSTSWGGNRTNRLIIYALP